MTARPKNFDWLALSSEEPLEPELPICDPHHHLWDKRPARVAERYLLDEILEDVGAGHNVVSTVFIECGAMYRADATEEALRPVGETEFVNGIAAMSASNEYGAARIAAGIVGTANLTLGDGVATALDAHLAAGGGRFRGIRQSAAWDADPGLPPPRINPGPGLYLRDDFRAGFKHLAPRQLSFEVWCYHRQIPEATALARAFPETTLILNHFGGPLGVGGYAGKSDEVYAEWRASVAELATCPNVVAKLGGINMELNGFGWHEKPRPPSSQELMDATRRYYEFTIERFGVDRCMFESNFPVDKASCGYGVLWNSFKRLTANYSASDKAMLFHDTAARVYRLERASAG
ncbi:MAG TPA: amidohydrolase family protein [Chloroflexota bacterium]|jgi:predicted TIM-barrel fold metal-dependent hydrolase